jgi:hypothetical protein
VGAVLFGEYEMISEGDTVKRTGRVASVPVGSLLAGPTNVRSARVEGPHGLTRLSLDEDTRVRVQGARGELLVEVCDGSVRVVSSDCPERRCVSSGAVSSVGECIVCVPNAVTVTVGGERGHDLDAVVR